MPKTDAEFHKLRENYRLAMSKCEDFASPFYLRDLHAIDQYVKDLEKKYQAFQAYAEGISKLINDNL